jgi:hypothetical protein
MNIMLQIINRAKQSGYTLMSSVAAMKEMFHENSYIALLIFADAVGI